MVERNLSIAIALMVVRQIQIIIAWGMGVFPPLGQPAITINVIDPISMAILVPLVAVGGRRILAGSVVVNIIWFVVALFATVQFLVGILGPTILFIAPLIAAIISTIISALTYSVYKSRGKQPVTA